MLKGPQGAVLTSGGRRPSVLTSGGEAGGAYLQPARADYREEEQEAQ